MPPNFSLLYIGCGPRRQELTLLLFFHYVWQRTQFIVKLVWEFPEVRCGKLRAKQSCTTQSRIHSDSGAVVLVCYCLGEASFRLRKIHLETLCVRSEVHRGFLVFVSIQLLTGNLGRNASIFTVQMVWGMSCISEMGEKHCPALGPELHFHICTVKVSSLAGHG